MATRRSILLSLAGLSLSPMAAAAAPVRAFGGLDLGGGVSLSGPAGFDPLALFVIAPGARDADENLARQCAAAGFMAICPTSAEARLPKVALERLSARHPGPVFVGGEGQGAGLALDWGAKLAARGQAARAVVGLNGAYAEGAKTKALALSGVSTLVMIADLAQADDSLAMGLALSRAQAAFELHIVDDPRPLFGQARQAVAPALRMEL